MHRWSANSARRRMSRSSPCGPQIAAFTQRKLRVTRLARNVTSRSRRATRSLAAQQHKHLEEPGAGGATCHRHARRMDERRRP